MVNFLVVIVLLIIVGAAIAYIVKEKKRGTRCIGCPYAGGCTHAKKEEMSQIPRNTE